VYDKRMAIFYANLVMSLVDKNIDGVMAAYRNGTFAYTDIPGKDIPPRRVDPGDYNSQRYRPNFEHITGHYRSQAQD
jgi:6-phosphofructokinase 1